MKARIHWNIQRKCWTVQTYKGCEWGQFVIVSGSWYTETKPNNRSNPRGFVVCDHSQVEIVPVSQYNPIQYLGRWKLIYDKHAISFNFTAGRYAYFTPDGAFFMARETL